MTVLIDRPDLWLGVLLLVIASRVFAFSLMAIYGGRR